MDRGVWEVVDRRKELRDFPFFDMIDFFEGSDGGSGIFCFGGGVNRIRGVEDGGVSEGIFVGTASSRAVTIIVKGRHSREVEVREERGVLIKVGEVSRGYARE